MVILNFRQTRVSLQDLTPVTHAWFSTKRYYRELLKQVYMQLARADSHHKFVSACLHNHTISWGLQTNVYPHVPKSLPASKKDWSCIIKQAIWEFLAALKTYYNNCTHHLRLQVTNLKTTIVARFEKTRVNTILNDVKSTYTKLNQRLLEHQINKLTKFSH